MATPAELTFCFTDIAGSTGLLREAGEAAYTEVLERHRSIIRTAVQSAGGEEISTEGDGFFLAFPDPSAALAFGAEAQRQLAVESWPAGAVVRVRMGVLLGAAVRRPDGDFVGLAVHRAARVASAAHGGQVLCTSAVAAAATLPAGCSVRDLGHYLLRDFDGPVGLVQLLGPGLPDAFPPPRAARALHGLPLPRTSLVGRTSDMARVREGALPGHLVTVVGPGGIGKSRVCLEAAAELAPRFADGLHLVELSTVADPDLVVATALTALDVRPVAGQDPLDALAHALAGERLLILDSCERCLDGVAPLVKELLDRCPGLAMLATSTEPVRVPGERLVLLEPLAVPAEDDPEPADADSVRLLHQRAVAGGAQLDLLGAAADLAVIARRLDGIPLALELAAGRIAELGLPAVIARLDDRFALLTNGFRTALPRHRTLEAMVAWTVELLGDDERDVFRRLSCLDGRWPRSGLPTAVGLLPDAVLSIDRLAGRSLLRLEGEPSRVRMLDTVRAFGRREAGPAVLAEVRGHIAGALGAQLDRAALLPEDEAIAELDQLAPDVRSLLAEPPDGRAEVVATATGSLATWFEYRGFWAEGRDLFLGVAQRCSPGRGRACALIAAATQETHLGNLGAAVELAQQALAEPGVDDQLRAFAYLHLSLQHPTLPDGRDPLEEALTLSQRSGHESLTVSVRMRMAIRRATAGDVAAAEADFAAILPEVRRMRRWSQVVQALVNRGGALIRLGRADEAEACLEEGRALAAEHSVPALGAMALSTLALLALQRGDAARAVDLAEERVALAERAGDLRGQAAALGVIATAAPLLGRPELARDAGVRTLEIYERLQLREGLVMASFNLAVIDSAAGRHADAAAHASRAVQMAVDLGQPVMGLVALAGAAGSCCLAGHADGLALAAAFRAVAAGPPPITVPLDPPDLEWLAAAEGSAAGRRAADAEEAARSRGAALDLPAALDLATAALAEVRSTPDSQAV